MGPTPDGCGRGSSFSPTGLTRARPAKCRVGCRFYFSPASDLTGA
uniref:Uncharacterized protein n=1 Tax=Arundo donax TaxID=35708 RepID=A0A0A9C0G5_ARUDO